MQIQMFEIFGEGLLRGIDEKEENNYVVSNLYIIFITEKKNVFTK